MKRYTFLFVYGDGKFIMVSGQTVKFYRRYGNILAWLCKRFSIEYEGGVFENICPVCASKKLAYGMDYKTNCDGNPGTSDKQEEVKDGTA